MKKFIALTLALVLSLSLLGCTKGVESCPAEESGDDSAIVVLPWEKVQEPVLEGPPVLTVVCGQASVEATRGGYHWIVPNGDGTMTATIADSAHPLAMQGLVACLDISGELTHGEADRTAQLRFAAAPDEVTVRCWGAECWGQSDAPDRTVAVTRTEDGGFQIDLWDTAAIYEVTAVWKASEYSNTAAYSFYTDTGIAAQGASAVG